MLMRKMRVHNSIREEKILLKSTRKALRVWYRDKTGKSLPARLENKAIAQTKAEMRNET